MQGRSLVTRMELEAGPDKIDDDRLLQTERYQVIHVQEAGSRVESSPLQGCMRHTGRHTSPATLLHTPPATKYSGTCICTKIQSSTTMTQEINQKMSQSAIVKIDVKKKLPLVASGKVRDLYAIDDETLLFVASDRISAYDVIMENVSPKFTVQKLQFSKI
jgi:hypothetical protein